MNPFRHRLAFCGAWTLGIIALFFFPGFESKGLIFSLIIGIWPYFLFGEVPGLLFLMLILSAVVVGCLAWLMDQCKLSAYFIYILVVAVTVGMTVLYMLNANDFESWRAWNSMYVSETYRYTKWDFHKSYLIPKTLVGGIFGLYMSLALGFLYSVVKIFHRRSFKLISPSASV